MLSYRINSYGTLNCEQKGFFGINNRDSSRDSKITRILSKLVAFSLVGLISFREISQIFDFFVFKSNMKKNKIM